MKQDKHVILVGMPGCGKSSTGLSLSKRLNLPFVDTDQFFEKKFGMDIKTYWSEKGEVSFRAEERKIFCDILTGKQSLIATGGGLPIYMDNMSLINDHFSVYIHISPKELLQRLLNNPRPILISNSESELDALYNKRHGIYNRATVIVNSLNAEAEILNNLSI